MREPVPAARLVAGALGVLLFSAASVAAPATEAGPGAGAPAPGSGGAARAQVIMQELVQIQNATLAANPELAERQQEIADLVRESMRENGHTPVADVEKMNEIRETLQSGDVGSEERRTLMQEFRSLRAEFVGAQRAAAAEPEIREAQQAFQQDLLVAMQEHDPRTQDLIQQMQRMRQQAAPG